MVTYIRFLDTNGFPLQPHALESCGQTLVWRFCVVVIDFQALYPGVTSGQGGSVVIDDQYRFPMARPEQEHFAG
jgi:hypothetical protein